MDHRCGRCLQEVDLNLRLVALHLERQSYEEDGEYGPLQVHCCTCYFSVLCLYMSVAIDSHLLQRLKLLVEKLASMRTVNIDPPIWGEWTIEPHRKVCSIFISLILS